VIILLDSLKASFKKNRIGIILMLISSFCVCFGQLFWKISENNEIIYLFLGFALYGIGALVMIIAYRYGSLSVLHPMLSINYVFALVLSFLVLHESISWQKLIGIFIIIIGVALIGGGDEL
jgi:undecaprenyl phosphate-alpha-L-ara4N flippase subunit ArnE